MVKLLGSVIIIIIFLSATRIILNNSAADPLARL